MCIHRYVFVLITVCVGRDPHHRRHRPGVTLVVHLFITCVNYLICCPRRQVPPPPPRYALDLNSCRHNSYRLNDDEPQTRAYIIHCTRVFNNVTRVPSRRRAVRYGACKIFKRTTPCAVIVCLKRCLSCRQRGSCTRASSSVQPRFTCLFPVSVPYRRRGHPPWSPNLSDIVSRTGPGG